MFGFIQIPLLSLNPCFLWPLNPFLLQTVSEKNPTSIRMCHNQKAEISCSTGQILVTLVALLLMSKHNYSGFVLRMQLYLWLLEEHLFFCCYHVMYILENKMIIYHILPGYFIPHTYRIQGGKAILYWPNPSLGLLTSESVDSDSTCWD